jgi:hypothetical protein
VIKGMTRRARRSKMSEPTKGTDLFLELVVNGLVLNTSYAFPIKLQRLKLLECKLEQSTCRLNNRIGKTDDGFTVAGRTEDPRQVRLVVQSLV